MPTAVLPVTSANNDSWKGLINGGEAKHSRSSDGSAGAGNIYFYLGDRIANSDITINKVTLNFYPCMTNRTNTTLYKVYLEYMVKVEGGDYKVGNGSWVRAGGYFPSSYPSSPWQADCGQWTYAELKTGISMSLRFYIDTTLLEVEGAIKNVTVAVDYTVNKRTLTVSAAEGGTASGGGTFESGTVTTITAVPKEGYRFVKWSDGDTNAVRQVSVTSDMTYTAYFEPIASDPKFTNVEIEYTPPLYTNSSFVMRVSVTG